MVKRKYRWDDWSGGEYGILSPEQQKKNMWSGDNLVLYDDGRLGPRAGLSQLATTTSGSNSGEAAGHAQLADATWIVYQGTTVRTWDETGGTWNASATVGAIIGAPAVFCKTAPTHNYLLTAGNGLDRCTHVSSAAPTILAITMTAFTEIGAAISLYRDRMYVSDDTSGSACRVRYSDANDYTTFGTLSYFDVGDATPVAWMGWSGSRLIIIKENLETWAYQGVPGRDTLSRLNEAQLSSGDGLRMTNNRVVTTKNGAIYCWIPG